MRVIDFDHLVLNVANVERSLKFYCETLGLEAIGVQRWRAGEFPFPSVRINQSTIIDLVKHSRHVSGIDHFCLVVEPLDWQEVIDSGVFGDVTGPVENSGARGDAWSIYILDPDENKIELRWYPQDQIDQ